MQPHDDTRTGFQGDAHMLVDAWLEQFQIKLLQQPGDDDFSFNLSKGCADTNPRAAAKGYKTVGQASPALFRGEAFRVKTFRVGPEVRLAVGQVRRIKDS